MTYHSLTNNGAVEGRAGTRAVMNPATGVSFAEVSLLDEAQAGASITAAAAAISPRGPR